MIKITYFAHGTTTDNEKNIFSGCSDVELSELGIKQSLELKNQIDINSFDVVFCSDLKRAINSAELTFKGIVPIVKDSRLREIDCGIPSSLPVEIMDSKEQNYITTPFPYNGESYEDVKARIADFLEFLKINHNNKSVAIVAHKAPQLALDILITGKSWEQAFADDWRKRKAWQPGWEYVLI